MVFCHTFHVVPRICASARYRVKIPVISLNSVIGKINKIIMAYFVVYKVFYRLQDRKDCLTNTIPVSYTKIAPTAMKDLVAWRNV
jgi:hypothetical protein